MHATQPGARPCPVLLEQQHACAWREAGTASPGWTRRVAKLMAMRPASVPAAKGPSETHSLETPHIHQSWRGSAHIMSTPWPWQRGLMSEPPEPRCTGSRCTGFWCGGPISCTQNNVDRASKAHREPSSAPSSKGLSPCPVGGGTLPPLSWPAPCANPRAGAPRRSSTSCARPPRLAHR